MAKIRSIEEALAKRQVALDEMVKWADTLMNAPDADEQVSALILFITNVADGARPPAGYEGYLNITGTLAMLGFAEVVMRARLEKVSQSN